MSDNTDATRLDPRWSGADAPTDRSACPRCGRSLRPAAEGRIRPHRIPGDDARQCAEGTRKGAA